MRVYCYCKDKDGKPIERVKSVHAIRGTYIWACPNCDCRMESNVDDS